MEGALIVSGEDCMYSMATFQPHTGVLEKDARPMIDFVDRLLLSDSTMKG